MSTQGEDLAVLYGRELDRLAGFIADYAHEANLWVLPGDTKNSPGTLALHLVGNLHAYIGAGLGATGYVRDREAEFADRDVPREVLLENVAACKETITRVLGEVTDQAMDAEYPGAVPDRLLGISTRRFLLHLLWHLGWHLGQIYYHRLVVEAGVSPSRA